MNRHSSQSCSCTTASAHKHHSASHSASHPASQSASHSTSSAFSASANPDEDWTKISDLAERRRIQNRIAQRNYRKKLKKRLEDLERRAGSNSTSPSPEQKYAELDRSTSSSYSPPSHTTVAYKHETNAAHSYASSAIDFSYPPLNEDRSMFSYQHTRQLSASPSPLFPYEAYPTTESSQHGGISQATNYFSVPFTSGESSSFPYSLPPLTGAYNTCAPGTPPSIKVQRYDDDDINPFSLSYASMAGMDMPSSYNYQAPAIYTPPPSDSFNRSLEGSPSDFTMYPLTPCSLPLTPPPQV